MIDWGAVSSDIVRELLRQLTEHGVSNRNIAYFVPLSVREAARLNSVRNKRGRPKERYPALTTNQMLHVLSLMYAGDDVLTIINRSGYDPNSITLYLFESDVECGRATCVCGQNYVYIGDTPLYCAKCSPHDDAQQLRRNIPRLDHLLPARRSYETYRSYNLRLLEIQTQKLIDICRLNVVMNRLMTAASAAVEAYNDIQGRTGCHSSVDCLHRSVKLVRQKLAHIKRGSNVEYVSA